ncbi:hypothetical protein LXL04_037667 [Taraxacum kok-saghyz]
MEIGGFHKQQRRKMVKSEATENGEERSWWWIVGKRRRQWTGRQSEIDLLRQSSRVKLWQPWKDLYSRNLKLLVPFFEHPSISLQSIKKVMNSEIESVMATYLKLPWRPLILIDGITVYDLDNQFTIVKHVESWSVNLRGQQVNSSLCTGLLEITGTIFMDNWKDFLDFLGCRCCSEWADGPGYSRKKKQDTGLFCEQRQQLGDKLLKGQNRLFASFGDCKQQQPCGLFGHSWCLCCFWMRMKVVLVKRRWIKYTVKRWSYVQSTSQQQQFYPVTSGFEEARTKQEPEGEILAGGKDQAREIFGNRWTEIAKRITSLVSFKGFVPSLQRLKFEWYVGAVIILCSERRREQLDYSFIDSIQSKGVCEVPFTSKEIVVDFYNELKSITFG